MKLLHGLDMNWILIKAMNYNYLSLSSGCFNWIIATFTPNIWAKLSNSFQMGRSTYQLCYVLIVVPFSHWYPFWTSILPRLWWGEGMPEAFHECLSFWWEKNQGFMGDSVVLWKKTETKNPGTLLGHMYIQMIHWKEVGGGEFEIPHFWTRICFFF